MEQAPAILRREAHRLAISGHGECGDEVSVGRIGTRVAVGLEIRKQRLQRGHFPSVRESRHAAGGECVAPGSDVFRAHRRKLLPGAGLDTCPGQELRKIALVSAPRVGGGGTQQPSVCRRGHLVAQGRPAARELRRELLAGKSRNVEEKKGTKRKRGRREWPAPQNLVRP